jgi:hypothetical protein
LDTAKPPIKGDHPHLDTVNQPMRDNQPHLEAVKSNSYIPAPAVLWKYPRSRAVSSSYVAAHGTYQIQKAVVCQLSEAVDSSSNQAVVVHLSAGKCSSCNKICQINCPICTVFPLKIYCLKESIQGVGTRTKLIQLQESIILLF